MTAAPVNLYVNPTAGRDRAGKRLARIEELLVEAGINFKTQLSTEVGDLERQVRAAVDGGADRIVVAGGDGSIHEAVNGIMAAAGTAKLGVIPTGTGNDFAKASEIPLDWEHATTLLGNRIASGASWRCIDVGRMNERYFANGVGIGFDAKVTKVINQQRWQSRHGVPGRALRLGASALVRTPSCYSFASGRICWQRVDAFLGHLL